MLTSWRRRPAPTTAGNTSLESKIGRFALLSIAGHITDTTSIPRRNRAPRRPQYRKFLTRLDGKYTEVIPKFCQCSTDTSTYFNKYYFSKYINRILDLYHCNQKMNHDAAFNTLNLKVCCHITFLATEKETFLKRIVSLIDALRLSIEYYVMFISTSCS